MRRSAGALLLVCVAAPAWAQTVDATFITLVQGRQDPRDGNLYSAVPVFQTVALTLSDVRLRHVEDLKLVVSGWGELTLGAAPVSAGAGGDLDVGFVEGKLFDRRVELRLGRQLVFGGAARALPLDGASATVRLARHVGLRLYGGVPVTPRFGVHQGDAAAGARLFFRPSVETELGASFAEMLDHGRQARQDLGVDARWRALPQLTLTGFALLSLLELRLAEGDVALEWRAHPTLLVRADFRRTSPDLFLPRSSILSVFSQETRDEAGGDLYWRPLSRLRLEAGWHAIENEAGFGQRGGGRISASLGPAFETTIAAELRVLRLATHDGYVQGRLYATERLRRTLVVTLDLDAFALEQPINGQRFSLTSAATLGWELSPRWRAVVTGIADATPMVERRFECMAKLVYNQVFRVHEVHP